jgi:hypothetical protein
MSNTLFRAVTDHGLTQSSEDLRETIRRLTILAVRGLVPMFDPEKQMFCFRLKREGISPRYTLIALIGLHRLEKSGAVSPIPIGPVLDGLLANLDWIDSVGDLGLLLWLCALTAPQKLGEFERRLDVRKAFTRCRDARQGRTVELAWLLTGLSCRKLVCPKTAPCMKDLAFDSYRKLATNQGEQGIFGHLARNGSAAGIFRHSLGSFADQVFPIYAMTKFSQAYGEKNAVDRALDCALRICEAQGSRGQWWWNYDSSNGRVAGRFPLFSVHQHATGPMSLLELGEVIRSDFTPWIYKGLQWIGDNELAFDMQDTSANVVWRSISRSAPRRLWSTTVALLTRREDPESRHGLRVMFECRPDELGWLLYAFANRNQLQLLPLSKRMSDYDA